MLTALILILHMKTPTTPHPLSMACAKRLDILFGGTRAEIIYETLLIARESLRAMAEDETILYINTLEASEVVEDPITQWKAKERERIRVGNGGAETVPQRIEFIKQMVKDRNVKLVILNMFDFAAMTSRHRAAVFHCLKWLKDRLGARIVVVTMNEPTNVGHMAGLKLMARSIAHVGGWANGEEVVHVQSPEEKLLEARCAVEEAKAHSLKDAQYQVAVAHAVQNIGPEDRIWLEDLEPNAEDLTEPVNYNPPRPRHAIEASLKNNDLAGENVRVRRELALPLIPLPLPVNTPRAAL